MEVLKQCNICRLNENDNNGRGVKFSFFFNETCIDKETGKGYVVPRHICSKCAKDVDKRIRGTANGLKPRAMAMNVVGSLKA